MAANAAAIRPISGHAGRVSAGASHLDWWPALAVSVAYAAGLWALGSAAVAGRDVS
jgi:hypothetical protein